jgi:raffinose/stachyose/melibiose transport system permease protein
MEGTKKPAKVLIYILLIVLSVLFIAPVAIILMNSFKGRFFISDNTFAFPNASTFVGIDNYVNGINKTDFLNAFKNSLFITVCSVLVIVFFNSMAAWYITRTKTAYSKILYYLIIFSMVVPFQMVMFTMSKMANMMHLDNPLGIIVIYLGYGAGLSVFMFGGFVKSIPLEIEEAAMIDGCNPIQTYFRVVFPILKPISITVAILETMWIWNDYLLPYLVLGTSEHKTIPIAVQYLQGGYGSKDMGALMALLVLAIIPVVIFYALCQKNIIKGIITGAVKG